MISMPKFRVRGLKAAHDKSGLTPYMVGKRTGVSTNTVVKYVESDEFVIERVEGSLIAVLKFFGLDWRDANVVEIVFEEASPSGQIKTPIAVA